MVNNKVKQILKNLEPLKDNLDDLHKTVLQRVAKFFELDDSNIICSKMINNLKSVLKRCSLKEHQSGLFRALVLVISRPNLKIKDVAEPLDISRRSVSLAKKRKIEYDNNEQYEQLIKKPCITRVKKSPLITKAIKELIDTAFTPSSNSVNVLKRKLSINLDNTYEFMVKH